MGVCLCVSVCVSACGAEQRKPYNNKAMSTREGNGSREDHPPRDLHNYQYVGPYRLEKTLGKGQTGRRSSFVGVACSQMDKAYRR